MIRNNLVSLVPFMSSNVHVESLNWLSSFHKILLGEICLSHVGIVSRHFAVVRTSYLCWLRCNKFYSLVPMACFYRSLNSFGYTIGLYIMLNCSLYIFLLHKIVSILFLERYNMLGEMMTCKVNRFSVGISSNIRI